MWLSRHPIVEPCARASLNFVVAVAVPACNEAAFIGPCIQALAVAAANAPGSPVHVVVLVNNSSDETAAIARSFCPSGMRLTVVDFTLAREQAHAGGARREACERAMALLPPDGVLMTTDADSRVDPQWIAANLAELAAGADAVAGVVAFDEASRAALPRMPLRALEWRLSELQAQLSNLLDPRAHDPWPNHIWAWGASLALTASAYCRVGGLPSVPLAEDRALAAAIERADLRLRHSHAPVVFTSSRHQGRAPGGFADLLQSYSRDPTEPCDSALEPTAALLHRLRWRARLRRIATEGSLDALGKAAWRFGYEGELASGFGALWSSIETQCPVMARARVLPATLAAEVALAERVVGRIKRRAASQADTAPSGLAA